MKTYRFLWLCAGVGAAFWLLDSAIDSWLFDDRRLLAEVFTSEPEEIRLRLTVWGVLALAGYYGQQLITALQAARDELERRVQERTNALAATNATLREEIAEHERTEAALKVMSRKVHDSQEEERRRIARDLHDEIGQKLTLVKMNLQGLQRDGSRDATGGQVDESLKLTDQALQKVRDVSLDLRPSMLDDLGLVSALRWYADRHAQRSGVALSFNAGDVEQRRIPRDVATSCFRIAQEVLTNVARHAGAHNVWIDLAAPGPELRCTIRDDGTGFDVAHARQCALRGKSLGVLSMQERAELVGGGVDIVSAPGDGTEVRTRFPL